MLLLHTQHIVFSKTTNLCIVINVGIVSYKIGVMLIGKSVGLDILLCIVCN